MSKVQLPASIIAELVKIPETGMGYHRIYVHLKGPGEKKEIVRIKALVVGEQLTWPDALGKFSEYKITKITEITKENSHHTSPMAKKITNIKGLAGSRTARYLIEGGYSSLAQSKRDRNKFLNNKRLEPKPVKGKFGYRIQKRLAW